jgi:hypothetical protein
MLENGAPMVRFVFSHVSTEHFLHPDARRLADLLVRKSDEDPRWDVQQLVDEVDDEPVRRLMVTLIFTRPELSAEWQRMGSTPDSGDPHAFAIDAIRSVLLRDVDDRIREQHRALKAVQERGGDPQDIHAAVLVLQQERKRIGSLHLEREDASMPPPPPHEEEED